MRREKAKHSEVVESDDLHITMRCLANASWTISFLFSFASQQCHYSMANGVDFFEWVTTPCTSLHLALAIETNTVRCVESHRSNRKLSMCTVTVSDGRPALI